MKIPIQIKAALYTVLILILFTSFIILFFAFPLVILGGLFISFVYGMVLSFLNDGLEDKYDGRGS